MPNYALATLIIAICLCDLARADDCDAVLSSQLMDRSVVIDDGAARQAFANSFCNKSYNEASSRGETKAAASINLFSASGDDQRSQYEKAKTENCGNTSSEDADSKFRFAAQRALKSEAIAAWTRCKESKSGLSCWIAPHSDPDYVTLVISWRPVGSRSAQVRHSEILNGKNVTFSSTPNNVYRDNTPVARGGDTINIRRDGEKTVHANLTIIYDNDHNESRSVSAPFLRKVEPVKAEVPTSLLDDFEMSGVWCAVGAPWRFRWTKRPNGYQRTFVLPSPAPGAPAPTPGPLMAMNMLPPDGFEVSYTEQSIGIVPPGQAALPQVRVNVRYKIINQEMIETVSSNEQGMLRTSGEQRLRWKRCN